MLVEDVEVADLRVGVDGDRGVARDDDAQLADLDLRLDVRLVRDRADVREVELQVADAELVRRLQRRRRPPGCRAGCRRRRRG